MYIQGHLQPVFDALYELGVIDPVLKKDWKEAMTKIHLYENSVNKAVQAVNSSEGDVSLLIKQLRMFDATTLEYLAMEVAREFADYHARERLH